MKYKCTKENKIIYKIHHRFQRNLFTKKITATICLSMLAR